MLTMMSEPNLFLFIFFISILFGSFLNVLITRLPIMIDKECKIDCYEFLGLSVPESLLKTPNLNLFFPNSHCLSCKEQIKFYDNIPIISYLFLNGKCRNCSHKIPFRYFLVEVLTPIFSVLVISKFGLTDKACYALLFTWALIALSFIDLENTILPDQLTLGMLWFGVFVNLSGNFVSVTDSIIGVILGYLFLWSMYWLFKLATNKEGLGYGDFKLLAMIGAWVGFVQLPMIVFLSAALGCLIAIPWLIMNNKSKNTPIPFGPFLSIAGFVTMLYGDIITKNYYSFFNL